MRTIILFFLILTISCVEPYAPPISDEQASSTMVVDGFIDGTSDVATIKLSYATALSDKKETKKLTRAKVWIEDDKQNNINLTETELGTYTSNGATFNTGSKYRLHIDRGTDSQYESDYVELVSTPPIDSVSWEADDLDIKFSVTTHDPSNKANYFKWDFLETYEYTAPLQSQYIVVNGEAVFRSEAQSIHTCWQTEASQDVLTNSVEQLGDKVVYKYPIHRLAGDDIKLWRLYSILVRQQTLEKDAYTFWSNLKETTENLGGLFDTMPTEVNGNMHSSNPDELVLGYFYASEVTEKRIFVHFYDLPDPILHLKRMRECVTWTILPNQVKSLGEHELIVKPLTNLLGVIVAWEIASDFCLDCRRYRDGTLQKPDFWPPVTF